MPKDGYKKLNIFIAAPSDVATEKARIISVVEQLNHGLADEIGIVFEVKEWSQVTPSMGRGQKIIFDQLPVEQWDIMIGILWLRYGTPAGGSQPEQSGTHEEFTAAYESWQKTGKPHIIFYQCVRPPEDLKKVEPVAWTKITDFFKQFETNGENQGLYRTYNTIDDFERLVRNHLEKILLEYSDKNYNNSKPPANDQSLKDIQPISTVLGEFFDQIDDDSRHPKAIYGVPTGFIDLDKLTNGLQPSNFLVIASQSAQSKTSFLLSIARNAALIHKKHVAIFSSLGMSNTRIVQHLIVEEIGLDAQRLSVGKLLEDEWPLLTHAIEVISNAPIFLDDTPALTIRQLKDKSQYLAKEYGLDLIIVDNLQFLRGERKTEDLTNNPNYIDLKILAHELKVPILTGLQLTRSGERRSDKRPYLSDLYEFDSLEDSADVIMFIHFPYSYEIDAPSPKVAEIIIAKHNFGPVGSVELIFRESLARFENAATRVFKPKQD